MARARAGFTLIELLIVTTLIALLLGIGFGALARLDLGDRVAASQVHDVLRSSHNWAVARSAPARVRIDAALGTIRAEGLAVIGTWHFESPSLPGAFGLDGLFFGGQLVDDGFVGKALSFAGEPARARVEIPVQEDPAFDLRLGFALSCALRPEPGAGAVLDVGGAAGLETRDDGSLRGWFAGEIEDEHGEARRGQRVFVDGPARSLRTGRWSQVELRYDRARLSLRVDGVLVGAEEEDVLVWRVEGPLVISPSSTPWPGSVDSLVVSAVRGEDQSVLPRGVRFEGGTPREIVFAAGGRLDREVHREPVRFALEFEDGRRMPIQVSLYGTVE